jgi:hypothetical protein
MATQEFYIRASDETDARGPFTLDQLSSLVEAGQVTPETLYYDTLSEQWVPIDADPEVKAALFPEKKRLRIRARDARRTTSAGDRSAAPITVDDMLAAADNRTEGAGAKTKMRNQLRVARIGLWSVVAMFLASSASLLLSPPAIMHIGTGDFARLFSHPFALLGACDLLLALFLCLQMVSVYPLVRFRALMGIGFFGVIFWSYADPVPIAWVTLASAGMYFSTIFISAFRLAGALLVGFSGSAAFALYMLG